MSSGDTIVLRGKIDAQQLRNRSFSNAVTIDAKSASFNGQLIISNVNNLKILGGTFGSSVATWQESGSVNIYGGSNINFVGPKVTGNGGSTARGLRFTDTVGASVENGIFTGLRLGVAMTNVTNGKLLNNTVNKATSDGFNIVGSHGVIASNNVCQGTTIFLGAHADCIQMWSLAGTPVQSDITIVGNSAYGNTQGFTSFDPARGGGLRINISDNRVETSMPQGIACYNCVDSIFSNNLLITMAGSRFRTTMNIIGGHDNTISGNTIRGQQFTGLLDEVETDAGFYPDYGPASYDRLISSVPEPRVWSQFIAGFAIIGGVTRRRRVPGRFRLAV